MSRDSAPIVKIGAIIQRSDGRLLVVRKAVPGRTTYIIPGGRPEPGETESETLHRELEEELGVRIVRAERFAEYDEPAEFEDRGLHMVVYDVIVKGVPKPQSEILELAWVDSRFRDDGYELGSTLANHVIPALVRLGRLD